MLKFDKEKKSPKLKYIIINISAVLAAQLILLGDRVIKFYFFEKKVLSTYILTLVKAVILTEMAELSNGEKLD